MAKELVLVTHAAAKDGRRTCNVLGVHMHELVVC